jgi:transcriptional regulator with XRE-family HTH domain
MATIEEKVSKLLTEKGLSRTKFGEALGYKFGYQGYHALFVKQKSPFTPSLRAKAAAILGVDPDYFDDGDGPEQRRRLARFEFEAFKLSPFAALCDEATMATLERMTFAGGRIPTRHLYRSLAMVMMGHWDEQTMGRALALNSALDMLPPIPEPPAPAPARGPRGNTKKRNPRK